MTVYKVMRIHETGYRTFIRLEMCPQPDELLTLGRKPAFNPTGFPHWAEYLFSTQRAAHVETNILNRPNERSTPQKIEAVLISQ